MKKGRISVVVCFFIASIILCSVSYGQVRVNWEEFPALAKTINYNVPEGKALLVFEGKEDFRFVLDNENIDQPVKDGLIYKLLVSIEPSSGGINISSPGAESYPLNYGRPIENSLPALNNKEIRYFKLSIVKQLICFDQTRELKKINADIPAEGDDALIILFPNPQNLDLQFEGAITSEKHENDRYRIYMKTGPQKLTIKSKNYFKTIIDLDSLKKEVRYFRIQPPQTNEDIISEDPNIKVGSYVIETIPSGAVIQMVGNPPFNKNNFTTPYSLQDFKAGKEIITLSLDRFEPIKDTIEISSSKGKKSKYKLIPKFAFLNCNIEPTISISKVFMNGKELVGIMNGIDFECPKGTHNIEISAPHYYSQTKQISFAAGQSVELNVKLRPKMGSLSILSGVNADGAEVIINDKKVGKIPLANLPLQEGSYNVRFNKSDFISEESAYTIEVSENKHTKFNDLKMINMKKVHITTEPVSDATIYIDDKQLNDKTNLNVKLGLGKHIIRIEHENYKPILTELIVNQENENFNYTLEKLSYLVSFETKPSSSTIYIDGKPQATTPANLSLPLGNYTVKFTNPESLNKSKFISVSAPMTCYTKLFPKDYIIIGADYGLDQVRLNAGIVSGGFLMSVGLQKNLNTNMPLKDTDVKINSVSVYDPYLYNEEVGRIYNTDSLNLSLNGKIGFTIKKPFVFIVTAGCSFIQTDKFQKVFKAKHSYMAEDTGKIIHTGDLFSVPVHTMYAYTAITAGLMLPIAQTFYLSADYYSDSDIGPGYTFGLGFIIK